MDKSANIWQKAAIAGSLWASFEIILGSFLHNLHVPMSGTFLAFLGISLMIAFHRIWKEKGLFWRAGLICALMKSISPSAIIFGPMVGIFLEAVLLESVVKILGANLIGYILAAAVAMNGVLLHKTANYLITYGWDFVKILENLYNFLVHQIHVDNFPATRLLELIMAIYAGFGVVAALLGFVAGERAKRDLSNVIQKGGFLLKEGGQGFSVPAESAGPWLLLVNLMAIIGGLFLINFSPFSFSILFTSIYMAFCFYRYSETMRFLKKPGFWLQLGILTVAAAIFYNGITSFRLSAEGLLVGLKMDLRALVVIFGFSAISVELRNPLIKNLLSNRKFGQLYQSTSLAFATLPNMIANMPASKEVLSRPVSAITGQVTYAGNMYKHIEKESGAKANVIILTGTIDSGKTTLARMTVEKMKAEGMSVSGFLAQKVYFNTLHEGYDLFDISTGVSLPLARCEGDDSQEHIGCYFFSDESLQLGRRILSKVGHDKILFIDEIGRLELNAKGWSRQLDTLVYQPGVQVWIVRSDLVQEVCSHWNIVNPNVVDVAKTSSNELLMMIQNINVTTLKTEIYA